MPAIKLGQQKTDWIGGVSNILIEYNNGDWSNYRPEHETQNNPETWGCALFSGTDSIETLFMYFLYNNLIPKEYVKWLTDNKYFINGFINFSDAYSYQFAEVEPGRGTFLYKANDAIRLGLVPESIYSFKDYFIDKKTIPPEAEKLKLEFKKRFTINWYWVENIEKSLKSSPLQATVRYADGDGILSPIGDHNHAIMVYKKGDYYDIDDSYNQPTKKYHLERVSNFIGYSLTINTTNMDVENFVKEYDLKWIFNNNTGEIGRIIQGKLRTIETQDRGVKMLLDDKVRENGKHIIDAEWKLLPKLPF